MALTYKLLGSVEAPDSYSSELVFTSIPQGFDHLIISGLAGATSGTPSVRMRMNDSSSNYSQRIVFGTSVSTGTNAYMDIVQAAESPEFYAFNTTIFDYASSFHKNVFSTWAGPSTSGTSSNQWEDGSAVTSLTIYLSNNFFSSGTRVNVYGVAGLDKGNGVGGGGAWSRYAVVGETLTSSGTWFLPTGVTSIDVVAVGGGANGGPGGNVGPSSPPQPGKPGGSGGRGGSIVFSTVNVSAPVSYTIGGAGGTTTFSSPVAVTAPGAGGAPAGGGGGQGSPGGPGSTTSQSNLGIGGVNITVGGGGGGGGGAGNGAGQNAGGGGTRGTNAGNGGGGGGKKSPGGPGGAAQSFGSGGGGGGGAGGWNQYGSQTSPGGAGGGGQGGRIILYYKAEVL